MSSTPFPENPTLKDCQTYAKAVHTERGFDDETISEKFMLLMEECGELAKAIRKNATAIKNSADSKTYDIPAETADVLICLLDIANKLGIDLETAYREKEEVNRRREWK